MLKKVILFCSFLLIACNNKKEPKLNIAVAANMQYAMKEIGDTFFKETGISCQLITGASGKLTSQIENGAPFDVFLSADIKYPTYLYQKKLTSTKPKVYAYGKLALWSKNNNIKPQLGSLTHQNIKHIAIANTKTAPYGKAALEVLKQREDYKLIEPKLVYGESIGQVNQFIHTKSVEIGFTSLSSVLSTNKLQKNNFTLIDERYHSPIQQGIVVLKTENTVNSNLFKDFLLGDKSKSILEKFGYRTN